MPRSGLRNLGLRILEPAVFSAVPDENRATFLDLVNETAPLHATSSWA